MNLTSRTGRHLAAGIALACSAILLPAAALAVPAAAGTPRPSRRGGAAPGRLCQRRGRPSTAAPTRGGHAVQLQGGTDSHPVTGPRRGPGGHRYRGRLPAYLARLEADRDETDRQGQLVVLVRDGSLQPHGDPAQAVAQLRGALGHDNGEPAVGSGDRLRGPLYQALATMTAIAFRAGDVTVPPLTLCLAISLLLQPWPAISLLCIHFGLSSRPCPANSSQAARWRTSGPY